MLKCLLKFVLSHFVVCDWAHMAYKYISTRYKIPSFNIKLIFFHKRKYIGPELPLTDGLLFTTSRGIIFSFTSLMETETFQVK